MDSAHASGNSAAPPVGSPSKLPWSQRYLEVVEPDGGPGGPPLAPPPPRRSLACRNSNGGACMREPTREPLAVDADKLTVEEHLFRKW